MKYGLGLPQVDVSDHVDAALLRRFASAAESRGFDSLWILETGVRVGPAAPQLAALPLLSFAAALTSRVRLGTSVLLPGIRNPIWLAQELSALDQLSEGRLIVGVGLGRADRAQMLGIGKEDWVSRFEESLEVMKALWAGGEASFTGDYWDVSGLVLAPTPMQRPHPELWFGAAAPAALRRAARLGSGWMGAGASSGDDFVEQVELLSHYLEAGGRDREQFAMSKRVFITVDDDERRTEDRIGAFFGAMYGSPELGSRTAVYGPPEKCASALRRLKDAGADLILLNPIDEFEAQLDALRDRVIPLVEG